MAATVELGFRVREQREEEEREQGEVRGENDRSGRLLNVLILRGSEAGGGTAGDSDVVVLLAGEGRRKEEKKIFLQKTPWAFL